MTTPFQPRNPDYKAFLQRYVAEQGFLQLIGVQLARSEPGSVDYRVPFRPDLGQHQGFFHGGVLGGVAEAVMGAAAYSLVGAEQTVVGAEFKINLLSPGRGAALLARGTVLKPGRTLTVCRAEVFAEADDGTLTLCAAAQGAMAVVGA